MLRVERYGLFFHGAYSEKLWLFRMGYIIFRAWYEMKTQGPLFKNYEEFEVVLAEHQAKHPSERWVLCSLSVAQVARPGSWPACLFLDSTFVTIVLFSLRLVFLFLLLSFCKESDLFLPYCSHHPYHCVWESSSLRRRG